LSGFLGLSKDRPKVRLTRMPGVAKSAPDASQGKFNAHFVSMWKDRNEDVSGGAFHFSRSEGPTADAKPFSP
jgi:hypothetical protein